LIIVLLPELVSCMTLSKGKKMPAKQGSAWIIRISLRPFFRGDASLSSLTGTDFPDMMYVTKKT
jgi:hypothetical protein